MLIRASEMIMCSYCRKPFCKYTRFRFRTSRTVSAVTSKFIGDRSSCSCGMSASTISGRSANALARVYESWPPARFARRQQTHWKCNNTQDFMTYSPEANHMTLWFQSIIKVISNTTKLFWNYGIQTPGTVFRLGDWNLSGSSGIHLGLSLSLQGL